MSEFLGSIWWLAVSLGVLVTFHEFGHYWVARRCGVRVLRFSIGFGAPLWKRVARDGTEYVIAAIPLGGYVKMLDERENMVPTSELPYAFNRKPVWQRIAIVAAGPVANLVLCVALLWAMFVIGRPDYAPVVGHVEGVAQASGLQAGDMVLAVGKRETRSWTDIQVALLPYALDRHDALLRVQRGNLEIERSLRLSTLPKDVDERRLLDAMGLEGRHVQLPARVGKVEPGTPADGVLQADDLVLSIDGTRITRWSDISPAVEALGKRGGTGVVEVKRKGQNVALDLVPRLMQTPGRPVPAWVLGVTPATPGEPAHDAVLRYGPAAAVPAAFREAAQNAHDLVSMIGRAFTGRVELRNTVAGPVTIGRTANYFASQGVAAYLSILALLSLSLGVMNLLPIPILDGGHLLYYLIELVKGSPVSERAMAAGQYIGLALIAGLMGLAFYNDIVNNLLH